MNETRDSEGGTIEEEEVMAGQSDVHTPNECPEGYGVRHPDVVRQQQRWGRGASPLGSLADYRGSVHVLEVDSGSPRAPR